MLMLVSVDLMIRMRWFLSGSRIYNIGAEWGKKIGTKTREKLENKLAEEFKEEIIQTLEEVLRQTSDARELHNLIQNWVEGLEELDFKDKEQYPSGGGVKLRGPLGQLCDFCGKLVGWKWAPIKNDKSTGRKRTGLKDYELRLYGSDGADPMLRITTDGDTNNPYLRQVGESSFRQ
jgi:hypothetical protein